MDTVCVELEFSDGSMITVDTIAVENEVADNMYERSELDYLIYNIPLEYADLVLNGNPEVYIRSINHWTNSNDGITYIGETYVGFSCAGKSNAIKYRYNN